MDTRLLYAMFDMLADFVEVEKAWMNVVFTKRKPWSGWGRTHWWRSRDEGLAHLEWEIGLGDPNLPEEERNEQQAKDAQEVKDLYTWWKDGVPIALILPKSAAGIRYVISGIFWVIRITAKKKRARLTPLEKNKM